MLPSVVIPRTGTVIVSFAARVRTQAAHGSAQSVPEAVTNATCKVRPLIHLPDFRGQANETSIKMCGTMRQDSCEKSTVLGATKPVRVKQHREKGHLALEVGSDEVCEAFQSRPRGWVDFPFEVEEIFAWDA